MIHNANNIRKSEDGLKVGGHQASSASIVSIMVALYFKVLQSEDRVAVKPHAAPVFLIEIKADNLLSRITSTCGCSCFWLKSRLTTSNSSYGRPPSWAPPPY